MLSGDLRHKVEIQRSVKVVVNHVTEVKWQTLKTVWAKVNGLYGHEKWEMDIYEANRTVIFTIRFKSCPDLTVRDRLVFRGKFYNISHIDNVKFRDQFLKITATAVEV